MRIYVAAPWARRNEARLVRDQLEAAGHTVTSRWLDAHSDHSIGSLQSEARGDLEDIDIADGLVLLNLEKSEGKAVETGYALALDIPVFIIGGPTAVFHWLPEMRHVSSVEALLDLLPPVAEDPDAVPV